METDKRTLANQVKEQVERLNRLCEKTKENNLIVELNSNEGVLGYVKDRFEVKAYEKVMY